MGALVGMRLRSLWSCLLFGVACAPPDVRPPSASAFPSLGLPLARRSAAPPAAPPDARAEKASDRTDIAKEQLQLLEIAPGVPVQLRPGEPIELPFNDVIDLQSARDSIHFFEIQKRGKRSLTVRFEQEQNVLRVHPEGVRPGGHYVLRLDETLRSRSSRLGSPLEGEYVVDAAVRAELDCDGFFPNACDPNSLLLRLSAPVSLAALKRAIRIEPAIPIEVSFGSDENENRLTFVGLKARFAPGRPYRVRIARGALRDVFGRPLESSLDHTLTFRPPKQAARLEQAPDPLADPSTQRWVVPVLTQGQGVLTIQKASPTDVWMFLQDELSLSLDPARSQSFSVAPGVDGRAVFEESKVLQGKSGLFFAGVRSSQEIESRLHLHDRSPLRVAAWLHEKDSLLWVTDTRTGAPVAGASVEIRQKIQHVTQKVFTGTTGDDGAVRVASLPSEELGVLVQRGEDLSFVRGQVRKGSGLQGILFTDRSSYAPGEFIHLRGMVRPYPNPDGRTFQGQDVLISFYSLELPKARTTVDDHGFFSATIQVPAGLPYSSAILGTPFARVNDLPTPLFAAPVSLAPSGGAPEAQIHAQATLDRASYTAGEAAHCRTQIRTAGRGHRDASVIADWIGQFAHVQLPRVPGFLFSFERLQRLYERDIFQNYRRGQDELGFSLSTFGSRISTRTRDIRTLNIDVPYTVSCEVDAVDDLWLHRRDPSPPAIVYPSEFFLGLRLMQDPDGSLRPEVIALSPQGKRVAGVEATAHLFRVYPKPSSRDRVRREQEASCSLRTSEQPSSCLLRPLRPGQAYRVQVSARDSSNHLVQVDSDVIWNIHSFSGKKSGEKAAEAPGVRLQVASNSAVPGASIEAIIVSDFPEAQALLTLEREGVRWHRVLKLPHGETRVAVPIPGGTESRALVRMEALGKWPSELAGKTRGPAPVHQEVALDILPSEPFSVRVRSSKEHPKPGEEIEIAAEVQGAPREGAEVTLYAIDEGSLPPGEGDAPELHAFPGVNLDATLLRSFQEHDVGWLAQGFREQTPSPFDQVRQFGWGPSPALPLGVRLHERAWSLSLSATALPQGRWTLCYQDALPIDVQGRVQARCKLPDANTTYRLVAVAMARGRPWVSHGTAQIQAKRSFSVRLAAPPVVRAGDHFDSTVVLEENEGNPTTIEILGSVSGALRIETAPFSVQLQPNERRELPIPVDAVRIDQGVLRFVARGERGTETAEVQIDVQAPAGIEEIERSGVLTAPGSLELGDLGEIREDAGSLTLLASGGPVAEPRGRWLRAGQPEKTQAPSACQPPPGEPGSLELWFSGEHQTLRWNRSDELARTSFLPHQLRPENPILLRPSGTAHYLARLRYAPRNQPDTAQDEGILVKRWIEPLAGRDTSSMPFHEPTQEASLPLGELALVTVIFEVRSLQRSIALDVPIPAGTEPVFSNFSATYGEKLRSVSDRSPLRSYTSPTGEESQAWQHPTKIFVGYAEPGPHRYSFVVRAMTTGRFQVPPARAEAAGGGARGRSAGAIFEVVRPAP